MADTDDDSESESEMYWGYPVGARRWHAFEDGRSLCGGWMMSNACGDKDPVEPDEDSYREGDDCKECCRRAGILDE